MSCQHTECSHVFQGSCALLVGDGAMVPSGSLQSSRPRELNWCGLGRLARVNALRCVRSSRGSCRCVTWDLFALIELDLHDNKSRCLVQKCFTGPGCLRCHLEDKLQYSNLYALVRGSWIQKLHYPWYFFVWFCSSLFPMDKYICDSYVSIFGIGL